MPIVPLVPLVSHMRWADARVAAALREQPDAPEEPRRLFAHVAAAEHLWWARVQGEAPRVAVWPTLDVAAAASLAAECADAFAELVAGGDDTTLDRVIGYRNTAGTEYHNTVRDIVMHVAMHGSHHRGQILRELRRAGFEPPYVDYIGYARRDQ
ncbi:MAG TPA: DinB family protein [Gemmatimonadaceae bacterium]